MSIFDPAFIVQKQANLAKITGELSGGFYTANFRGGIVQAKSAGDNPLSVGDICALVDFGPIKYVIKSNAGYPTRWIRNISEWHDFPAALFLKYIMRNNPKLADFKIGSVIQVVSDHVLRVMCWDGVTRDLTVEYAGNLRQASVFSAGDPVLCYWKNGFEWIVIGKDLIPTLSVSPTSWAYGNITVDTSSIKAFTCTQTNSEVPVQVDSDSDFPVSMSGGEPWTNSITLATTGGTFYCKFQPTTETAFSGNITVTGELPAITIPLTGTGIAVVVAPYITISSHLRYDGQHPAGNSGLTWLEPVPPGSASCGVTVRGTGYRKRVTLSVNYILVPYSSAESWIATYTQTVDLTSPDQAFELSVMQDCGTLFNEGGHDWAVYGMADSAFQGHPGGLAVADIPA